MKKKRISSSFIITGTAIALSLLLAFVLVFLTSPTPVEALKELIFGPFESKRKIGLIVTTSLPSIFTGLAFCIMFRAGQFNLSPDGIFYVCAAVAAAVGIGMPLPKGIHPLVGILLCVVLGGILCLIPAFLKMKYKANIIVSSLMYNYILFYFGMFLLAEVTRDKATGNMVSAKMESTARFDVMIPKTGIHWGALIAAVAVVWTYWFLFKTKKGYEIRLTGDNPQFAKYAGINIVKTVMMAQLAGGILAGIGGAVEMYGMYDRFQWITNPGYGWEGFVVAVLAKNNPAYVPLAALFLGYLSVGSDIIVQRCAVPPDAIPAIRAIMIILIGAQGFMSSWKHKRMLKEKMIVEGGQ